MDFRPPTSDFRRQRDGTNKKIPFKGKLYHVPLTVSRAVFTKNREPALSVWWDFNKEEEARVRRPLAGKIPPGEAGSRASLSERRGQGVYPLGRASLPYWIWTE